MFSNTIANWLSADGVPITYASNINVNNNVPINLPGPAFGTSFTTKPRAGYVRVKSNIIRANATTKVGTITATDGTNITNLYVGDVNPTANGLYYDTSFFFWYDWAVANINITNISTTNNSATFDVEVVGMQ